MENDPTILNVVRDLGRLSEAISNQGLQNDQILKRFDKHDERIEDLRGTVANLDSSVRAQSVLVTNIVGKNYDERIKKLEDMLVNYDTYERDLMFYRRVIGGTWSLIWKVVALVFGSGLVTTALTYWLTHHP